MTNALVQKYLGKTCWVSTGAFGNTVKGEITEVADNWVEIKTPKGTQLFNAEYITSITLIDAK